MNDLDLCLEVVSRSRSRQPLRYIWRWISRKPLEVEVWFQRTTNSKWHMGYRMVSNGHVTDNVTWPWKVKRATPIRLERNISKMAGDRDSVPFWNDIWSIKWSRDLLRHLTPKCAERQYGRLSYRWLGFLLDLLFHEQYVSSANWRTEELQFLPRDAL